jgi:hypothetical protein
MDMEAGNKSRIWKLLLSITAGYFLLSCGATGFVFYRLSVIGEQMEREFAEQREQMRAIVEAISDESAALSVETAAGFTETLAEIRAGRDQSRRTERIYAALLDEQKKRTVESLYKGEELAIMAQNADALFRERKYKQANDIFAAISTAQPENRDVRFYELYSLFLNNRMDTNHYSRIRDGLLILRQAGYNRAEIGQVLDYIASEEGNRERTNRDTNDE